MNNRLLAVLLCCTCWSHAADLSLQITFPEKIVIPRPPDQTQQTNLQVGFALKNEGQAQLKIRILEHERPTWRALVVFKLVDRLGKEVPGGFVPTENFAGGQNTKEIRLAAGKSIILPYAPFLRLLGFLPRPKTLPDAHSVQVAD